MLSKYGVFVLKEVSNKLRITTPSAESNKGTLNEETSSFEVIIIDIYCDAKLI